MDKKENLIRELQALGQYYRNDWSDFDGRSLRSELSQICSWYKDENDVDEFKVFSEMLEEQTND